MLGAVTAPPLKPRPISPTNPATPAAPSFRATVLQGAHQTTCRWRPRRPWCKNAEPYLPQAAKAAHALAVFWQSMVGLALARQVLSQPA